MRSLGLLLLTLTGVCVAVSPPAKPPAPLSGAEAYRRTLAGSAWVVAAGQGKGSGFVVDARRRLLLTCCHVVGSNERCEVVFVWNKSGRPVVTRQAYLEHMPRLREHGVAVEGKVIRRDEKADLALVELASLPAGVSAVPLAAETAGPGDAVWVVGNRYDVGTLFTAAGGRVRAARRLRDGYFAAGRQYGKGARLLQTDVPINEGDSGGPLVNEAGAVVGVCAAVAWEADGGGLCIDLAEVKAFLANDTKLSTPVSHGAIAYRKALPATVLVQYEGGDPSAGVVIQRERGLVLTTADAVAREKTVEVTFALEQPAGVVPEFAWYRDQKTLLRRKGHLVDAVVLAVDARRNLALIEAKRLPATAAEVAISTTTPQPGDGLHLLSHPRGLGLLWCYSHAIVRQRDTVFLAREEVGPSPTVLIVQAPLREGEGGGPAVNDRGELCGLISGKVEPQQQIAHVLDASEIRDFLDEVRPLATPRTPAEHIARAERFIKARRFEQAREGYTAALRLDPKNAAALAGRGWVAQLLGQSKVALVDADLALALDAKQVKARCVRAAVFVGKADAKRAMAECDMAVKDDPKYALAFALRALARLAAGDEERALSDVDESIWLDAKLALAYLARGRVLARQGQADRALTELSRAIALDPADGEIYRLRGDVHWGRSDVDLASADYSQALKYAPDDALALLGRGRTRLAKGQHDAGLIDLDYSLRLRPALAEAYLVRGGEKVRRNWVDKGTRDLLEAVRRRPGLLSAALSEVERKSADLPVADESEALRGMLAGVAPRLDAELQKRVETALTAAKAEKDDKVRVRLLREMVGIVRAKAEER